MSYGGEAEGSEEGGVAVEEALGGFGGLVHNGFQI